MGIPRYLDGVEYPCTPPLILAFSLNLVKPCQIFFVSRSMHESEDSGFSLHESNVEYDELVEGMRNSRCIAREKDATTFGEDFGSARGPLNANRFLSTQNESTFGAASFSSLLRKKKEIEECSSYFSWQ